MPPRKLSPSWTVGAGTGLLNEGAVILDIDFDSFVGLLGAGTGTDAVAFFSVFRSFPPQASLASTNIARLNSTRPLTADWYIHYPFSTAPLLALVAIFA